MGKRCTTSYGLVANSPFLNAEESGVSTGAATPINSTNALPTGEAPSSVFVFTAQRFPERSTAKLVIWLRTGASAVPPVIVAPSPVKPVVELSKVPVLLIANRLPTPVCNGCKMFVRPSRIGAAWLLAQPLGIVMVDVEPVVFEALKTAMPVLPLHAYILPALSPGMP